MTDLAWPDLTPVTQSVARQLRERRRARLTARLFTGLTIILLAAAALTAAAPYLLRAQADMGLERDANQAAAKALAFPYNDRRSMIQKAVAYNRELAASGQPTLGVAQDPFTGRDTGDWDGADDASYNRALDVDGIGTMGRIRIPEISVDLRIGHGSGQDTLENGAGHLHGTSLPVGGRSTHTVITAHTDFAKGTMFDRLTELRQGDPFYLEVMGRTLAYKVTSIRVTDPIERNSGDFDDLKIHKGRDEATLITCTGPGLTQRLLVTGVRNRMPDQLPYPDQAGKDLRRIIRDTGLVTAGVLAIGVTLLLIHRRRKARKGVEVGAPRHERDHARRH